MGCHVVRDTVASDAASCCSATFSAATAVSTWPARAQVLVGERPARPAIPCGAAGLRGRDATRRAAALRWRAARRYSHRAGGHGARPARQRRAAARRVASRPAKTCSAARDCGRAGARRRGPEARQAQVETAVAALKVRRAAARRIRGDGVANDGGNPSRRQQAAAKLRESYLAAQRASVLAPVTGYVAKRSVQLGQQVAPGAPLLAIVPLVDVWVDANFKESQLRDVRIGQPSR